jgi:hypothetical protein
MPHFRRIILLSLFHDLDLNFGDEIETYTQFFLRLLLEQPPYQRQSKFLCFLYNIYVIPQKIHIISIDQQRTCCFQILTFLVALEISNGVFQSKVGKQWERSHVIFFHTILNKTTSVNVHLNGLLTIFP